MSYHVILLLLPSTTTTTTTIITLTTHIMIMRTLSQKPATKQLHIPSQQYKHHIQINNMYVFQFLKQPTITYYHHL